MNFLNSFTGASEGRLAFEERGFKGLQLIDTIYLIHGRKNLAFLPFLKIPSILFGIFVQKHISEKIFKSVAKIQYKKIIPKLFRNKITFL